MVRLTSSRLELKRVSVFVPKVASCTPEGRTHTEIRDVIEKLIDMKERSSLVHTLSYVEHQEKFQVFQEVLSGVSLDEYLTHTHNLHTETIRNIVKQIVYGILCLHEAGLFHGHLSEHNIGFRHNSKLCNNILTRFEIAIAETQLSSTNEAVAHEDIIAVGRILYRMYTGMKAPDTIDLSKIDFSQWSNDELVALMKKLLSPLADCTVDVKSIHADTFFDSAL